MTQDFKDRITDIVYCSDVADIDRDITALDAPPAMVEKILEYLTREFQDNVAEAQTRIDEWAREKARCASRLDAIQSLLKSIKSDLKE